MQQSYSFLPSLTAIYFVNVNQNPILFLFCKLKDHANKWCNIFDKITLNDRNWRSAGCLDDESPIDNYYSTLRL